MQQSSNENKTDPQGNASGRTPLTQYISIAVVPFPMAMPTKPERTPAEMEPAGEHSETPTVEVRTGMRREIVLSVLSALAGIVVSLGGLVGLTRQAEIIAFLKQVFSVVPFVTLLLGCGLLSLAAYWLRCRKRLIYGLVECLIGSIALGVALGAVQANGLFGSAGLSVVGAIYFIVRGLDNVGRWIKQDGRFVEPWKRIFGEHFT